VSDIQASTNRWRRPRRILKRALLAMSTLSLTLSASLVAVVVVAQPASAATLAQLGVPPHQCADYGSHLDPSCLGDPDQPDWMGATYYGSIRIKPSVVTAGQPIWIYATGLTGGSVDWYDSQIPGTVVAGCTGGSSFCEVIPPASPYPPSEASTDWSGGYQVINVDFCGFFGCAGSGDYYYVTDQAIIQGYVTNSAGSPVTNPTISVSGTQITNYDASTGFYSAIVNSGTYSVTSSSNGSSDSVESCSGQKNGAACVVTLRTGQTANANFQENDDATISGTVLNSDGTPAVNTAVQLTVNTCYDNSNSCVGATVYTDSAGQYADTVLAGAYTVAPTGLATGVNSDQPSEVAIASVGVNAPVDFTLTTGPVVTSLQDNAGAPTGADSITVNGEGFGSANSADTVAFCPINSTVSSTCVAGVDPVVKSDSQITVTTPDMTVPLGTKGTMFADAVVTNATSQDSQKNTNEEYEFGCNQMPDVNTGGWTIGGCFSTSQTPGQLNTSSIVTYDGTQLVSSGTNDADVNTETPDYQSTSFAAMQLNLGGNHLVQLLTGLTNLDLSQSTLTLNAAAGANIAGFPVLGAVTLKTDGQQTMTITTSVKLPSILGGATGTLTATSVQGQGVTSMNIVLANNAQESVANAFALSGLALSWTQSSQAWVVTASGTATSAPFTLNGNLVYGQSGITMGSLVLSGAVSLGGGVITLNDLNLNYSNGAWTASATVSQATGTLVFTIAVSTQGTITSGSIVSQGPITIFEAITLQSFAMTYDAGSWSLAITTGAGGNNQASVAVDATGAISSFNLQLQDVQLGSALTLDTLHVKHTSTGGVSVYSGEIAASLPGSGVSFGGSIEFDNGAFKAGSVKFDGLHIPIGSTGVFITGGGAAIDLSPTLKLTGQVNLVFGPQVLGATAFGATVQMTYTFGSTPAGGSAQPATIDLSGVIAAGGVPDDTNKKVLTLGNGDITVNGDGTASLCLALGSPNGSTGCTGSGSLKLPLGEKISGQLNGSISLSAVTLTGQGSLTGTLPLGTAVLSVNQTGIAACSADKSVGASYIWGASLPSLTCPTSGFSFPTITGASAGGGDPTTGLNVPQGGTATVTASGFLPGELVKANLDSTSSEVGSATANDNGNLTITITLANNAATGPDGVTLLGSTSGLSVDFPLMVATSGSSSPSAVELLGESSVNEGASFSAAALADGTPTPTYSLSSGPAWLSVNPESGAVSGTEPNNAETSFSYAVQATNASGSATSPTTTVTVVASNGPTSASVTSESSMAAGDFYNAQATAVGAPSPTYSFGPSPAAPSWLSIDATSGAITGLEPNDAENSFTYSVVATNATGSVTSSPVVVTVLTASKPSTVTVSGPSTIVEGANYAAATSSDGGPSPEFSFAESPVAPNWLVLDPATGDVSGVEPNDAETTFSYALVATNDLGSATSAAVTVDVVPASAPTTVTVAGPSSLNASSDFDASVSADGTPTATYRFASTPVAPSWLSIDPLTGDISGIEPGDFESSFSYAVTATNSAGSATSDAQLVQVLSAPVFTSTSPPTEIDPGASFSYQFVANGTPDVPTYSLDPSAPSWLTINPTSGAVSGTEPNDGETSWSFYVIATNSQGVTVAGPFVIDINIPPVFVAQSPATSITTNESYRYQFSALGGADPMSYSLQTSNAAFLSINTETGLVYGVAPTTTNTSFTYSVIATDNEGSATAGPFTVTLEQSPFFTGNTPPLIAGVAAPYNYSFFAQALPDAATYAIIGAPSWLSINPTTGETYGTEPDNGEGSFSYSVSATNSLGTATTATFHVSVEALPLFSPYSPPLTVPAGGSYSYQFSATSPLGASGAPTYRMISAPQWLSVDPNSGVVSGTEPNNGEASFTYSVEATNNIGSVTVGPFTVAVDLAPTFVDDSPLTTVGTNYVQYSADFYAKALPDAAVYSLDPSAPSWLTINATTGVVSGREPNDGFAPFSYSVTATNSLSSTTVGPFNVIFGPPTVTGVLDTGNDSQFGVSDGDSLSITGTGFVGANAVIFVAASCAPNPGYVAATIGSSGFSVNAAGTEITMGAPNVNDSFERCPDHTNAVDLIVQGGTYGYSLVSGEYRTENLNSVVSEPADELDFNNPVAPANPTVTSVVDTLTNTDAGALGGGDQLTITGDGFTDASQVSFTDNGCTGDPGATTAVVSGAALLVGDDGTTITLTSPGDVADAVNACPDGTITTDVQVTVSAPPTDTQSQSPLNAPEDEFTFFPPTVTSVSDSVTNSSTGPIVSGDQLVITGTGLSNASSVSFVDAACTGDAGTTSVTVGSSNFVVSADGTTITLSDPGDAADSVNACANGDLVTDVVVSDTVANSSAVVQTPVQAGDQFTFLAPFVTSVSDVNNQNNSGPISGGDPVTIAGTGFTNATKVSFVDSSCTGDPGTTSVSLDASHFTVSADGTLITLTNPGDSADWANNCGAETGLVIDVVVQVTDPATTQSGSSAVSQSDQFVFELPVAYNVFDTANGDSSIPIVGGRQVVIFGSGLTGATEVEFVYHGTVEATRPATNIGDGNVAVVVPNFSSLADLVATGHDALVMEVVVVVPNADAPSGRFLSTADLGLLTLDLPTVTSVKTTSTSLSTGPLAGGEALTLAGPDFKNATAVAFQYKASSGSETSLDVPVIGVTNAGKPLSVIAPDLVGLVGLGGATGITLTPGQSSVVTSVRVIETNPVTGQSYEGVVTAPQDDFTFTIPPRHAPSITSASSVNATTGQAFALTVTTSGWPNATVSASGDPSWLKFKNIGNGTAQLSGTPTRIGTVHVTLTAKNGDSPNAIQHLAIDVRSLPQFSGPLGATAIVGEHFLTSIHAVASPSATMSVTGLPNWLTASKSAGDLKISGTPSQAGKVILTVTATNAAGSTHETFTLTVDQAPRFTSAATTNAVAGSSFAFNVVATGTPTPTLSSSGVPAWLTVTKHANGTATLSGTPPSSGSFNVTFRATNGVGSTAVQVLRITVSS
jgi:hypothetical protein